MSKEIHNRLSAMLTERGIVHDVFHFTSGKWEISYVIEGEDFRRRIRPDSKVCDQAWMDLPVIDADDGFRPNP